jgi:putative DNA primase/helicase
MIHDREQANTPIFWAAVDLAKAGYLVFPISPDTKQPSVKGGFYAGSSDISKIAEWITEGREGHDIGITTGLPSLIVVIDADTDEACRDMFEKLGPPQATTRRGGHWYFRHPQDGKVTSRKFAPGLDCKADAAYVIVPPSRNRSWTRGIPNLDTLPELPKDLKRLLREEQTGGHGHCSASGAVGEVIPDGSRNGTLTSLAGSMRRRGMGEAEIFAALEVTNRLRCKPSLPVEDVRRISGSVARYAPASNRPWWVKAVTKNV